MSKTLLVLAASTYQLAAIRAAKALGYRVVTTDNIASNPGHALADSHYGVDTTDQRGVLALAERERIDGIISPGTDVAVETAAYVAEQLRLPGPGVRAALALTRKSHFRQVQRRAGLPSPPVLEPGVDAMAGAPLPDERKWLVKPNRSSGSKGVFIVRSAAELASRIAESRSFSTDGSALIEEYVDGTQHTCEGFVRNGKVELWLITDRDTVPSPHTATKGHRVPSRLDERSCREAIAAIERVLQMVEVTDGPIDCDFVASDGRITLIEITPRLGGNSLSRLVEAALDFDLVSAAVRQACGVEVQLPAHRPPRPAAVVILGTDRSGRVGWNAEEARLLSLEPWVSVLDFDVHPGTEVEAFTNGRRRIGEALVTARSRDELDLRLSELERRLNVAAH